jgi:hypothetical protein
VDAETGTPLRAALSVLQDSRVVRQAMADTLGYYRIDSVPPEARQVLVRAFGYEVQRITLADANPAQTINVAMRRFAERHARVVLPSRRPPRSVTVTPTAIRADIPLGRDASGIWRWNERESETGRAEYMLSVAFDGDPSYALAFALFKAPGAELQSGSLDDLLRAGQLNLVRITGHRESPVANITPTARGEGPQLVIELQHIATASALWSDRPREARITVVMPGREQMVFKLPVTYDSTTRVP